MKISIVSPVYKAEEIVDELVQRIIRSVSEITHDFEIILVEDGSPDKSWETIERLSRNDGRVKGIKLTKNFGQHHAITCGLDFCGGEWVVVMDCDLQNAPEDIIKLYNKAMEGYEVVVALRKGREQDTGYRIKASQIFWMLLNRLTKLRGGMPMSNFGIYSRKVIESIRRFQEQTRSFGIFTMWVGFKRTEIEVNYVPRLIGKSGYTFSKLLNLALDTIIAYSNKLLKIALYLGFVLSFGALLYAGWLVIKHWFISPVPVIGWTSIMVALFFLSGLSILMIGVLGIYIGKIYDEVKRRPLYLIETATFKIHE